MHIRDRSAADELALEDDFGDILGKAQRGCRVDDAALARFAGAEPDAPAAWRNGATIPGDAAIVKIARLLGLHPPSLLASAYRTWHPRVACPANVRSYLQPPHPSNGYVVEAPDARELAIVDPAGDARAALALLDADDRPLRYILVTHGHADHCDAVARIVARHPHAQTLVHPLEAAANSLPHVRLPGVAHGDRVPFGSGEIRVFATPGHTDGAVVYAVGAVVFTGDTLFAGSIGRANGPRSTYAEMLTGIREHLLSRDATTVVLPGHGPPSTIELERRHNPFLARGA